MAETKKCVHCGADLPADASFCPVCARTQVEKESITTPKPKKRILPWILAAAAVVVVLIVVLTQLGRKTMYDENSAEISYKNWNMVLRYARDDDFHFDSAQDFYTKTLNAGVQAAIPLQLYVFDNEKTLKSEEFLDQLESTEIRAIPIGDSSAAECSTPGSNDLFPKATLESDVVYDTDCSENEIQWTFHMKNGDTIVLHEKMEINIRPEENYSYTDMPLDTMTDLQELIDKAEDELSPETAVTITLAPVVYEGDLDIRDIRLTLVGTEGTTINGKVNIAPDLPQFASFNNIVFTSGGIEAYSPFSCEDCTFKDCEEGILAEDGSWPMPWHCVFENCETGLHINTENCSIQNQDLTENEYYNNGTAILIEQVPYDDPLYLSYCVFEGNEADIDNRTDVEIIK